MPPPPSTRTILKSANLTSKPARPRLPTWDVRHLRSLWRLTTTTNWLTRKCPKTASAVLTRQAKVRGLLGDPGFRFELASEAVLNNPNNPTAISQDGLLSTKNSGSAARTMQLTI